MLFRIGALLVLFATATVVRLVADAEADVFSDDPYAVAVAEDVDPAPRVFETTLVAKTATRDIGGGVTANVWTYNGSFPGPEIRVRVGDTVVVHYRNELPLPSSIHWHGIELNNASEGTALSQDAVPPGGSFLYKFVVPRPGIFWYHPHHRPTNQVFRGLYGTLIVTDAADDTLVAQGVLPRKAATRTLVLSDATVCKAPGQNDTDTYDDTLPWAGGGPLPEQPGPSPADLCERPMDDHGNPVQDDAGRPVPLQAGDIPNIQRASAGRTNEGQTVLANGRTPGGRSGSPGAPGAVEDGAATVDVAAGQGLRLRAVNAATVRHFRLRLTDSAGNHIPLVRVGGEGGLLDHARVEGGVLGGAARLDGFDTKYERGEMVLGPSVRADLVVAVPRNAPTGIATLWTLDYRRTGEGYSLLPTVPVMHLDIRPPTAETYAIAEGAPLRTHPAVNDPIERLGPPLPEGPLTEPDRTGIAELLDPATFSPPKPGSANEDIRFRFTSIDDVDGAHDTGTDYRAVPHSASTRYARLGDLLELTVTNGTNAHHTFHLHGFSFQPLSFTRTIPPLVVGDSIGNYTFDYREFLDSVDIPAGYILRLRVRLDDRPQIDGVTPGGGVGRWVFHCHLLFHASLGMHSELVVLDPDGNEQPFVDADATSVQAAQGGTASATGTYADPDGDPVALSASAGTVTDLGGGRWAWSHDAGQAPVGRSFVYIDAVDARGLRDQAAFELHVDNAAPVVTVVSPAPDSAFAVGSAVTITASVADGRSRAPSCRFDWDDGTGPGAPVPVVGNTCADTRTIVQPGVRSVTVTATDGDGGTGSGGTVFAVYDRDGGFVTGSGTLASPAGPATFDLSAKYAGGAAVPAATVLVDVPTAGFRFIATSSRWLVVAGQKAQLRGAGVVGDVPGYEFRLTAVDGLDGVDRLRLKVWEAGTGRVVFDNAPSDADDIDAAAPPPISAGTVKVHRR